MREPYGNGTSYSSGAKPLRNVDPYAINNYALTEMLPELEQKMKVLRLDGRNNPFYNVSCIYSEIGYGKN